MDEWNKAMAFLDKETAQTFDKERYCGDDGPTVAADTRRYLWTEAKNQVECIINTTYPGVEYNCLSQPLLKQAEVCFAPTNGPH